MAALWRDVLRVAATMAVAASQVTTNLRAASGNYGRPTFGSDAENPILLAGNEADSELDHLNHRLEKETGWTEIFQLAAKAAKENATSQAERRKQLNEELEALEGQRSSSIAATETKKEQARSLAHELDDVDKRVAAAEKDAKHWNASRLKASAAAVSVEGRGMSAAWGCIQWIRNCRYQSAVALLVGILGATSIFNPPVFYEALTVSIISCVAAGFCASTVNASWGSLPLWMEILVCLEAAGIAAAAAITGFAGLRTLTGALLGAIVVHLASTQGVFSALDPSTEPLWFAIGSALGAAALLVAGREGAGVMLGSIVGGLLVASCVGFLAEDFAGENTSWLDFTDTFLLGGVFAENRQRPSFIAMSAGAFLGTVVVIIAAARSIVQKSPTKAHTRIDISRSADKSNDAHQEQLTTPLLATADNAGMLPQPRGREELAPNASGFEDPQAFQQPQRRTSDYMAKAQAAANNVRAQASGYISSVAASPQVRQMSSAMSQLSNGGSALSAPKSSVPPPPVPPPSLRPSSKQRKSR